MIISNKQVQGVLKTYADQNKTMKNKADKADAATFQKQDEVILSNNAQEFGQILQGLKNASDVRDDKVQDLSTQVANGTYHVNAQDIADKMISRSIVDNLY